MGAKPLRVSALKTESNLFFIGPEGNEKSANERAVLMHTVLYAKHTTNKIDKFFLYRFTSVPPGYP